MKKENILVIYNVNSINFKDSIPLYTSILELLEYKYNFYFGSFLNKKNTLKLTKNINFIDIIELNNKNYINWNDCYKYIEDIQLKYNFKKIYLFGLYHRIPEYGYGTEDNIIKLYNKTVENPKLYTTFKSSYNYYKPWMLVYHFTTKLDIPIVQINVDPAEIRFTNFNKKSKYLFHQYSSKRKTDVKYFPNLEYGYFYKNFKSFYNLDNDIINKNIDFIFGFSVFFDHRYEVLKDLLDNEQTIFKNLNYKLFYKNFKKDNTEAINTLIPKDQYLKLLLQSKYTYTIQALDKDEFSIARFGESWEFDTILLINDKVDWEQAFYPQHKELIDFYKRNNLICSTLEIGDRIRTLDYNKIIKEFKSLDYYKKMKDKQYYIDFINQYDL